MYTLVDGTYRNKETNKELLVVSFSGGRTSAYMTQMLLEYYSEQYELLVIFANTSREHEKTLEFINNCDQRLGFGTVWLEAQVNPQKGKGTKHVITSFSEAKRDGSVFEAVIAKYGIPNVSYLHCTRELKLQPMHSYLKSLGLDPAVVKTAIGIRADEPRRIGKKPNIVYPLFDWFPTIKEDILDYWQDEQTFDLGLEDWEGNCISCYKKSDLKLGKVYAKYPSYFEWCAEMEAKYSHVGAPDAPRKMYRGSRSTVDMIKLFEHLGPDIKLQQKAHEDAGCSESCEVY